MILYKKDSKGKIRTLEIITDGNLLLQISGLKDGAKVTNERVCTPKNVGKSNETTAEEQAEREADSKISQKLDEGYFITEKEALDTEVILPMLAQDYKKHSKKIDWSKPVFRQPKLDGMRALGISDSTLISRKGKYIDTLTHLNNELNILRSLLGGLIPDGELYAHGLSFEDNMKLIKKYRKGKTESIMFHVYDVIMDKPFKTRYYTLYNAFQKYSFLHIELVDTFRIAHAVDITVAQSEYLSKGYEGTIIRHGDAPYQLDTRSYNLLKYKDFKDMASKIIDVIPSEARPEQGVIVCEAPENSENCISFKASLKFSHKKREEILQNKKDYIGQVAEIRYFEETAYGIPRFPVCVGFRLDK
jgi:ATP-dependent DNA ligase